METKFWNVFSSGPILDTLGKHLLVGDIISLSRTCRALSGMYHEMLRNQWDIDALLTRFVSEPRSFRRQIGLAEALITGSFALEFFERPHWQANNLDVVVKDGLGVDTLCSYLIDCDNYELLDDFEDTHPHTFRHVDKVVALKQGRGLTPKKIRLYAISNHAFPVKSIIEGAWTTSIVNFISWRKAYSFFPSSTFMHGKSFMLQPLRLSEQHEGNWQFPIEKYRERGYSFDLEASALHKSRKNHPMQKFRKAGDKYSWRIPLSTQDIDVPSYLDPVPEEEYIYITEEKDKLRVQEHVHLLGLLHYTSADDQGEYARTFHYEAKWMRYNGFFL